MRRKLITSDEARPCAGQPTRPCSDCPMARDALPGWLGGATPEEYARLAHSDTVVSCHTLKGPQCVGMAIYRANVVKRCDPPNLRLPKDTAAVFATPMEFLQHHGGSLTGRRSSEPAIQSLPVRTAEGDRVRKAFRKVYDDKM